MSKEEKLNKIRYSINKKEPKPTTVIPQYVQRSISRGFESVYINQVAREEYDRINREIIKEPPKDIRGMFELINSTTTNEATYPEHFDSYIKTLETYEREPKRIVFSAPPQTGKSFSTMIALIWAAWRKHQKIMYVTYNAKRSLEVMRDDFVPILQQLSIPYRVSGNKLYITPYDNSKNRNSTITFTSGPKGNATGSSTHLIVIDDILKGDHDSLMPSHLNKIWAYFRSNILTRERTNLSIIAMMTRWHKEDLSGKILSELPDVEHIRIPAICDDENGDVLGREVGESLEFKGGEVTLDLDFFLRKKREVGDYLFSCMYQGTPSETVNLVNHISTYDSLPPSKKGYHTVYGTDIAYSTSQKSDYSTIVKLKVNLDTGDTYVVDHRKKQCLWQDFIPIIQNFSHEAGRIHWDCSSLEMKTVGDEVRKKLKMFVPKPTQKPKTVRAVDTANALNNGWLLFPENTESNNEEWQYFKSQLLVFDGSGVGHDDLVDALVSAYNSVKHVRVQILNGSSTTSSRSLTEREQILKDNRSTVPRYRKPMRGRTI